MTRFASVSLSADGNTAIVGGNADDSNIGAVWFFTHDEPLPIQLTTFAAIIVNDRTVQLDWTTNSETNNFGFDIQRSFQDGSNYSTLPGSFIPGYGTTTMAHHYTFVDSTATAGQWWYRLRQTDLDGSVHYTGGASVDILTDVLQNQLPDKFALGQNYPDPFNPSTTIQYQLPVAAKVTLKVYNILGQVVATIVDEVQEAGYKSVVWNAGGVASGVYLYRLESKDFVRTRKLMLLR